MPLMRHMAVVWGTKVLTSQSIQTSGVFDLVSAIFDVIRGCLKMPDRSRPKRGLSVLGPVN
jgi:hypothetical protein